MIFKSTLSKANNRNKYSTFERSSRKQPHNAIPHSTNPASRKTLDNNDFNQVGVQQF